MYTKIPLQTIFLTIYLGVMSGCGIYASEIFMKTPVDLTLIWTFAAFTFFIYTLNKYTDKEDCIAKKKDLDYFSNNPYFLAVSVVLMVFAIACLLIEKKYGIYHTIVLIAGIVYSIKSIPAVVNKKIVFLRLKDICFLKSITVALTWGLSFFLINWITYPEYVSNTREIVILMVSFTYATFVNTVFCDIRDYYGDYMANIRTVPVLLGIPRTYRYVVYIPTIIMFTVVSVMYVFGIISLSIFGLLLFNLLYPVFYIFIYEKKVIKLSAIPAIAESFIFLFSIGLMVISVR
jgi:4-hydroxybenzoate polyprenyltransferase